VEKTVPSRAQVVIIGGGIVGCSVAYHLARMGTTDVVLLEQSKLSSGTTWHAAGLVGQLRSTEQLTRLIKYGTDLYSSLEDETGLATGWKQVGALTVARTPERLSAIKRMAAMGRAFEVDVEMISPAEAGDLWPPMRIDDLLGAAWLPGDGKVNPTDATQSLAKGARMRGVRIIEGVRVTGIQVKDRVVHGVETDAGPIEAEIVVNCAGQWARKVGRMAGTNVPLYSAEHMYVVTQAMAGVHPNLPGLRDPDGYTYFKEEVGGLVVGGFEPDAKPWVADVPDDFSFTLLEEDWEHFSIIMDSAVNRVPDLATTGITKFYNGPESFTPDNQFLLGETPEVRSFFVAAGFNSVGIGTGAGAGMALAHIITEGAPPFDLWPVEITRFAPFHSNDSWLRERVKESLGLLYAMPWPNRELESARPLRRSSLHEHHIRMGACMGQRMGWERPLFFARPGTEATIEYSFGKQNWFETSAAEHRGMREAVGLIDQSSYSKFLLSGPDVMATLQWICGADVDVPVGRVVYTGMLDDDGRYLTDLTLTRLGPDQYLIVTSAGQTTHDFSYIERQLTGKWRGSLVDVTSAFAILTVAGPRSRALLSRVSSADFSTEAFPFSTSRMVDIGFATVRASRLNFVGELGWELYVPTEFTVGVYDNLVEAGVDLGVRPVGFYAMESLRMEKAFRSWGHDITRDDTPLEAGLGFAVKLGSDIDFRGRPALLKQRAEGLPKRLVSITLDDPEVVLWGHEPLRRNGDIVGHITSAGYGHTVGSAVALAYVGRKDGYVDKEYVLDGGYEIEVEGRGVAANIQLTAPYDPRSTRMRG
jgi:heterotetrameric sarcosine oxidase gamma subunit